MKEIEIKYFNFSNRLFLTSGIYWNFLFLIVIEIIAMMQENDLFLIITAVCIPILLIPLTNNFLRARKYLAKIEAKDKHIYMTIFDFNKRIEYAAIPIKDFRIEIMDDEIYNSFRDISGRMPLSFVEASRKTILILKRKNALKKDGYELILKQYKIGDWKKEKQMEVCKYIWSKQRNILEIV